MDPIQIVIIVISLTLTVLIVILGIQVLQILKEMKKSVEKMNKMLDDTQKVTGTFSSSVQGMGGLISGLKSGFSLFSSHKKGEDDE